MSFIYHSYLNPCPITGNTKNGCRTNQTNNLVHCRCSVDHPDWVYRGEDSLGFPMFASLEDALRYKDEKYQEWLEEKQRERAIREQQRQKQLESKLSPKQLDREYKQLLAQLSLSEGNLLGSPSERQSLINRGLTDEQIVVAGYVSVKQWQKIDSRGIDRRLPGLINNNGVTAKLNVTGNGILIPVKDKDGYIVGCQVRLNNPTDGGKYRWLSSPSYNNTPHNKLGEMPLSVFNRGLAETVYLCEGVGFKPLIASIRLDASVIGASGGNFAGSANTLKQSLEALGVKRIILLPDGGSLLNPHVLNQYKKLFSLAQTWGYEVAIAWWGQLEKEHNDIDEIPLEKLQSIKYISVAEFLKLAPIDAHQPVKVAQNYPDNEPDTQAYKVYMGASLFCTLAVLKGVETLAMSLLWVMFFQKRDAPVYIERELEEERILEAQEKQSFYEKQLAKIQKLFSKCKRKITQRKPRQIDREINSESDLTELYLELLKQGKNILDSRHCGEGKNHTIVELIKKYREFFASKYQYIFLIDSHHRNPSIEEIGDIFVDLNPRNATGYIKGDDGLYIPAPIGTDRDKLDIKGNCINAELFLMAYNLGHNPNDKTVEIKSDNGKVRYENPICAKCPKLNQCSYDETYFKAQRKKTFESKFIRCAAQSLPPILDTLSNDSENKLDYSKCLFISDEPGQRLKRTKVIETTYDKILREIDDAKAVPNDELKLTNDELKLTNDELKLTNDELKLTNYELKLANDELKLTENEFKLTNDELKLTNDKLKLTDDELKAIDDVRSGLKALTQDKTYYGINSLLSINKLKEAVTDSDRLHTATLKLSQHSPNFDALIPECESYYDLPHDIRKGVSKGAIKAHLQNERNTQIKEAKQNIDGLPPNALIYILKAINGESGIGIRINKEQITVTVDTRSEYADIFNKGQSIYLDATLSKERLIEIVPGLNPDNLVAIGKSNKPLSNVVYHAVKVDGFKTNKPSEKAIERVQKVIGVIKTKHPGAGISTITHKSLKEVLGAQGHWGNHSRGSNEFSGKDALIFAGLPFPNVGAIQDEYYAMYGTLEGFEDYYRSLVIDELIQGPGGRQRAQRYPDKQFHCYLIHGDDEFDLSFLEDKGAKVVYSSAGQYDISAGTALQATKYLFIKAIEQGAKTKEQIAQALGFTVRYVNKILQDAGLTLEWLIERVAALMGTEATTNPIRESSQSHQDYLTTFSDFFGLDPLVSAVDAVEFLTSMGITDFWALFEDYPDTLKAQILGFLYSLIGNDSEIRQETS